MHALGLTGGIGTGKSTVARMLAHLGAVVCDADEQAHAVLARGGEAEAAVIEAFGETLLDADGAIDRARLGARVFADAADRARLEAITHPLINRRIAEAEARALEAGAEVFVVEAALLVETGRHRDSEALIVVRADPAVVRARVAGRDGLTPEAIEARIAAQAPERELLAAADHVIDNSGSPEQTERQVQRIWERIRRL